MATRTSIFIKWDGDKDFPAPENISSYEYVIDDETSDHHETASLECRDQFDLPAESRIYFERFDAALGIKYIINRKNFGRLPPNTQVELKLKRETKLDVDAAVKPERMRAGEGKLPTPPVEERPPKTPSPVTPARPAPLRSLQITPARNQDDVIIPATPEVSDAESGGGELAENERDVSGEQQDLFEDQEMEPGEQDLGLDDYRASSPITSASITTTERASSFFGRRSQTPASTNPLGPNTSLDSDSSRILAREQHAPSPGPTIPRPLDVTEQMRQLQLRQQGERDQQLLSEHARKLALEDENSKEGGTADISEKMELDVPAPTGRSDSDDSFLVNEEFEIVTKKSSRDRSKETVDQDVADTAPGEGASKRNSALMQMKMEEDELEEEEFPATSSGEGSGPTSQSDVGAIGDQSMTDASVPMPNLSQEIGGDDSDSASDNEIRLVRKIKKNPHSSSSTRPSPLKTPSLTAHSSGTSPFRPPPSAQPQKSAPTARRPPPASKPISSSFSTIKPISSSSSSSSTKPPGSSPQRFIGVDVPIARNVNAVRKRPLPTDGATSSTTTKRTRFDPTNANAVASTSRVPMSSSNFPPSSQPLPHHRHSYPPSSTLVRPQASQTQSFPQLSFPQPQSSQPPSRSTHNSFSSLPTGPKSQLKRPRKTEDVRPSPHQHEVPGARRSSRVRGGIHITIPISARKNQADKAHYQLPQILRIMTLEVTMKMVFERVRDHSGWDLDRIQLRWTPKAGVEGEPRKWVWSQEVAERTDHLEGWGISPDDTLDADRVG